MRVLVVTNITPDPSYPSRGSFVRDQVEALRAMGVEVETFEFLPGSRRYIPATLALRRLLGRERFDLVHAHYGLAAWCAKLAGAKPLVVTFHGTDVRHPVTGRLSRRLVGRLELAGVASRALLYPEGGKPGLPVPAGMRAILPCGADLDLFRPLAREECRRRLGLRADGRYLFFPSSPGRAVKRHDRAAEVARIAGAELLDAANVERGSMPDWINAANAVITPSENEGFGLGPVEALACNVPVLSTPVGIAPMLLAGVEGCLVDRFDAPAWAQAAGGHLDAGDPRVAGRPRAEWFSAELMAARVLVAYRELLAGGESAAASA